MTPMHEAAEASAYVLYLAAEVKRRHDRALTFRAGTYERTKATASALVLQSKRIDAEHKANKLMSALSAAGREGALALVALAEAKEVAGKTFVLA